MMQLFNGDFAKIAQGCLNAPKAYQRVCFESMGRDVGGVTRGKPDEAIKSCSYAPEGDFRVGCLVGAVQDSFWDSSAQDTAINFCKLLTDKREKDECYTTIFNRMPQILTSTYKIGSFCSKVENAYQTSCYTKGKLLKTYK